MVLPSCPRAWLKMPPPDCCVAAERAVEDAQVSLVEDTAPTGGAAEHIVAAEGAVANAQRCADVAVVDAAAETAGARLIALEGAVEDAQRCVAVGTIIVDAAASSGPR